jgi:hypothetical protein
LTPWAAAALIVLLEMGPLGRLYQRWRGADISTSDSFGGSQSSIYEGRRHFGPANVAKSYLSSVTATPCTLLHYLFVILFRSQHESSSGQRRRCVTKPWENRGPLRINVRLWSLQHEIRVADARETRDYVETLWDAVRAVPDQEPSYLTFGNKFAADVSSVFRPW